MTPKQVGKAAAYLADLEWLKAQRNVGPSEGTVDTAGEAEEDVWEAMRDAGIRYIEIRLNALGVKVKRS